MPRQDALEAALRQAISQFWKTRHDQGRAQGTKTGAKDAGSRSMVTGGKQMDGFAVLFARVIKGEGIPADAIHTRKTTLPGYFRPERDWDLLVVLHGQLVATIEFKSHVGSFGNNFNNRVEEARKRNRPEHRLPRGRVQTVTQTMAGLYDASRGSHQGQLSRSPSRTPF